ncbi:MAG: aspartate dehydrogenase [Candidatus Bathyarchaeota archaeon]|nr:aspartate dehydrogenase [Candidatus Bathyarchaeota archaeon]
MKTVGLIGCGAIGTVLAEAIDRKLVVCDELIVFDVDASKAQQLKRLLSFPVTIVDSFEELLKRRPTVVVEAASQQAVRDYAKKLVEQEIDVIVMSTGALLDLDLTSNRLHVPSGAIGGLDAIASAALTGELQVTLTTHKNPKALKNPPATASVIYEGDAQEAARQFPREMNVAATLALAVKPSKVKVTVIADPAMQKNTHEINVNWKFGEMHLRFANSPHPENPKTSALAAWSAIKLLRDLLAAV